MKPTDYIEQNEKGARKFTRDFYELSLSKKIEIFNRLYNEEPGPRSMRQPNDAHVERETSLYNRAVLAILQHSKPDIKREYPVEGERNQSPVAKRADLWDLWDRIATRLANITVPRG